MRRSKKLLPETYLPSYLTELLDAASDAIRVNGSQNNFVPFRETMNQVWRLPNCWCSSKLTGSRPVVAPLASFKI